MIALKAMRRKHRNDACLEPIDYIMSDYDHLDDRDYFTRRQSQAQLMTMNAQSTEARIIHSRLEAHYAHTVLAIDILADEDAREYEAASIAAPLAMKIWMQMD